MAKPRVTWWAPKGERMIPRADADARLKALGYTLEHRNTSSDGSVTDSTWRRRVGTREVTVKTPKTLKVKGVTYKAWQETKKTEPVTRSLYVVESPDGLEVWNNGTRYTLSEVEHEEAAEAAGVALPAKQSLIVTDS